MRPQALSLTPRLRTVVFAFFLGNLTACGGGESDDSSPSGGASSGGAATGGSGVPSGGKPSAGGSSSGGSESGGLDSGGGSSGGAPSTGGQASGELLIGDPCDEETECPMVNGYDGYCKTNWTGGYCTGSCTGVEDCGPENVCLAAGWCVKACENDENCRDGYRCSTDKGCEPGF